MSNSPSPTPPPWTFGLPLALLAAGGLMVLVGIIWGYADDKGGYTHYFISGSVCVSGGVIGLLLARISYRLDEMRSSKE